jgi:hypothetical protein
VIEFFTDLLKREEVAPPAQAAPSADAWASQTQAALNIVPRPSIPAQPEGSPTGTPPEAQAPNPEGQEKAQIITRFVEALSNGNPDASRITKQVSKLARTDIQDALSKASLDEAVIKLLALPLGDRQKNMAFQNAIGMSWPHDGYIGRDTINALMEKVASPYRVPSNPYSPSKK